jgi:hypothetical protein
LTRLADQGTSRLGRLVTATGEAHSASTNDFWESDCGKRRLRYQHALQNTANEQVF